MADRGSKATGEETDPSSDVPFLAPGDISTRAESAGSSTAPRESLELTVREDPGQGGDQYFVPVPEVYPSEEEVDGLQRLPPPPPYSAAAEGNVTRQQSVMENKGCFYCLAILLGIGALLCVILVPLGFSDLDYYEMGFVRSKTTGKVDVSEVYMGGRHFIGVDKEFKKFKADAHTERFHRVIVFNKEKLQVNMTCALEYFLIPEELHLLHNDYGISYQPVLHKTVLAAIKARAAKFTVDQYRLEREVVAVALKEAAREALGGTCCRKNCTTTANCTKEDRGLFTDVRYFQLELISITSEQEHRFLRQVIESEKQDTEQFKQQELLLRKETERLKRIIENEATEISQNATAKAALITARAEASAKAVMEEARNSGLEIIYKALNISSMEHKKSFDYLRTLRDSGHVNAYVGFSTMIGKP